MYKKEFEMPVRTVVAPEKIKVVTEMRFRTRLMTHLLNEDFFKRHEINSPRRFCQALALVLSVYVGADEKVTKTTFVTGLSETSKIVNLKAFGLTKKRLGRLFFDRQPDK